MVKLTGKALNKRGVDETLKNFVKNLLKWALTALLIVLILGNLGVETTSFAAILAAAGLAIGLALQGSLSNFAGGVLIMIFKPFKIQYISKMLYRDLLSDICTCQSSIYQRCYIVTF